MPLPIEASFRRQDMAVRIETQEIAKGLEGDDRAGHEIPFPYRLPKKESFAFDKDRLFC